MQEGAVGKGECFQLFRLTGEYIYPARWVYILTMLDIYAQQAGYIDSPRGLKGGEMRADGCLHVGL